MKTALRIISLVAFGFFIFSFGNKPVLLEPEVEPEDIAQKIDVLTDSLITISGEIELPRDSVISKKLTEMQETLKVLKANVDDAAEAECFVTKVKCNEIEAWIGGYYDSRKAVSKK